MKEGKVKAQVEVKAEGKVKMKGGLCALGDLGG
jgi:hypothetical protein